VGDAERDNGGQARGRQHRDRCRNAAKSDPLAVRDPQRLVFGDLAVLNALQVSQLTLLLAGSSVDVSVGSSIRQGIQSLFAGKTQTLANLAALVAPYDNPTMPWWQANGYTSPIGQATLTERS
jgi:hypothetical protein